MVKYYRALALFILTASAYMSWKHGSIKVTVFVHSQPLLPMGNLLRLGVPSLFYHLVVRHCHDHSVPNPSAHVPDSTITLIALAFGWAVTVMLSPHKWAIIIPYSLLSLGAIGLTLADGVRKNRRGLRCPEKGGGSLRYVNLLYVAVLWTVCAWSSPVLAGTGTFDGKVVELVAGAYISVTILVSCWEGLCGLFTA